MLCDDPSEGSLSPAVLTFTDSTWDSPQTVTVTGANDATVDGDILYTVTIGPATSATDGAYPGLSPTPDFVTLLNYDNDQPGVTVLPPSPSYTTEAGGQATFGVVLDSMPTSGVDITITSTNTVRKVHVVAEGWGRSCPTIISASFFATIAIHVLGRGHARAVGSQLYSGVVERDSDRDFDRSGRLG